MIRYTLPYPPTTNHLFATAGAKRVKSRAYRAWIDAAGCEIMAQGRQRVHGPVTLAIALRRPDKRKRDLSNAIKAVEDLIVSMGVIDDDSLVQRLSVQWVSDGAPCTVLIMEHSEELAA